MSKKTWKDELPPLFIAAAVQFCLLRAAEWAKDAAETNENARLLAENHFYYAPQIVAVIIVALVIRFIRNTVDLRGVSFLEWLRSSALILLLGLGILAMTHVDQIAALGARTLHWEAFGQTRDALGRSAVYKTLAASWWMRFLLDLLGLLFCLLGLRSTRPVSTDIASAREAERGRDFVKAAEHYLRAGDVKQAKKAFRKANAHARLAALELREGKARLAAETYEKAGPAFFWEASRAWEAAGDRAKAAELAKAALVEARTTMRWDRLAEVAEAMEEPAMLAEASRRLAEVKPAGPGRTSLWRRSGDAAKAAGLTLEGAEAYRAAGDFIQAAELYLAAGRPLDAAQDFERGGDLTRAAQAAAQGGKGQTSNELQARDAEARGDVGSAAEAWRLAGNLERSAGLFERKGAWDRAAAVWREAGKPDRAAPLYQKAGDLPNAAWAYEDAGESEKAAVLYRDLGRLDKAVALFRAAGRWVDAAAATEALGQFDEAIALYQRGGKTLNAAQCALRMGHRDRAWELLMTVPRNEPGISEFFPQLAMAHCEAGEWKDAVHVLRAHLGHSEITKENVEANILMVKALQATGDTKEAEARLTRLAEYDPALLLPVLPEAPLSEPSGETVRVPEAPATPPGVTPPPRIGTGSIAVARPPSGVGILPLATPSPRSGSGSFPQQRVDSSGTFPSIEQAEMRYELLTELGRGGMGVVHKALDRKLDRLVAIKILPWQLHGDETAKRYFAREAKAIAALKHPNVVAIYDYGEGFGSLYLAMEYLEGPNLQSMLKGDPQRLRSNWRYWFVQAARGIAAAHAKGILHRDLKPANLMLDEHQTLRILDFGLARPSGDSNVTSKLIGTPAFFPPEVLRGESPSPASDVYSLGATFYTLATGRWPYIGDDVLVARLERDPEDPRPYAPQLTGDEVQVLMKSLARHRPERYPDAGELLAALLQLEG